MPSVLVVALEAWFSSARMPGALHDAGFRTIVLCTPASPLRRARGIDALIEIERGEVAAALAAANARRRPAWIVPADEQALYALHRLARGADAELTAAIRRSLGVPACDGETVTKRRVNEAAAALGITVPRQAVAETPAAAFAFARVVGYPVVLKKEHTFGGMGVLACRDDAALLTAWYRLQASRRLGRLLARAGGGVAHALAPLRRRLADRLGAALLVQPLIAGKPAFHAFVAQRGAVLAGMSAIAEANHPAPFGASSVVRFVDHPAMAQAAAALSAALGLSGFGGIDFILEATTGEPHLLELNPRLTPICHLGQRVGADLCAALFAAASGQPTPTPAPIAERVVALFPNELQRDAGSTWLASAHHDVPWDDPGLLAAPEAKLAPSVRAFLARYGAAPA
jgi:hypothetical protein